MIVGDITLNVKSETQPIVAMQGVVVDYIETGRIVRVDLSLYFRDDEVTSELGDPRLLRERISSIFAKPEVKKAFEDMSRKPRAYGDES